MNKRTCIFMLTLLVGCAAPVQQSPTLPEMRLAPAEVQVPPATNEQIGSSGVAGVRSKVLSGDPSKPGMYTLLLFVPAGTTIQAHSHRDNRMATVLAGEWRFAYGNRFDAAALKVLPAGSAYTEPGGVYHFARTEADAVVVLISGYGPTDTRYFDFENEPMAAK